MSETTTSEKPVISAETIKRILAFRDDRNWKQFHNPKDLAMSVAIEAGERSFSNAFSGPVRTLRCVPRKPR